MATGNHTFADRLKGLRQEAGLSQYALARRTGLSKQALSRLELGEREPGWKTVQLLALALGVDCRAFADPAVKLAEGAGESRPRGRSPKAPGEPQDVIARKVPAGSSSEGKLPAGSHRGKRKGKT